MASWLDLTVRLENTLHADERLAVAGMYRPAELPLWLRGPWRDAQAEAGDKTAVLLLNCKGDKPDDVVCMVALVDLERLTGGNGEPRE